MGGSRSGGTTSTTNAIPPELSGLTSKTAGQLSYAQDQPGFGLSSYGLANAQKIPGLTNLQQNASSYASQLPGQAEKGVLATGSSLANDPSIAAAYNTYVSSVKPQLQGDYGLMGLGKSTNLGDALARGAASQLSPVIQASLGREQAANQQDYSNRLSALQALQSQGATERGVASEQSQADQSDFLRRQALAESVNQGILGSLPSNLGQQVASSTKSPGMFKVVVPWLLFIFGTLSYWS